MKSLILPLIIPAAAAIISGCLSNRIDLVEKGFVAVDRYNCDHVEFSKVCIYQEGEHLVIDGKVKRKYFCPCGICRGCVDVDIVDAEGALLGRYQTGICPCDIPRKGSRESSFCIKSQMILPEGSVARLYFNRGRCVEVE
jgi:hypothetical protein